VVGSRGSVVPVFLKQRETGKLTVTDERMTRFWISLEQGVRFVIRAAETMSGGEVFVPKIPSMTVADLARAVAPEAELNYVGIRPGEKLHEVLISEDEARQTIELDDMFVVQPAETLWFGHDWEARGTHPADDYRYASNTNTQWLSVDQIKEIIAPIEADYLAGRLV
ncbi:UDP-N-acetylglucosamine 4,6-dehydratase (inverting), partial [bacterium]|nr:UDP-N-acetylglucosamine 4,6-dehydratase (inverting) [bacterium]